MIKLKKFMIINMEKKCIRYVGHQQVIVLQLVDIMQVGSEPIKIWNLHIRRIEMKMIHDLHDVYCLRWQPANDFSLWEQLHQVVVLAIH